MPPSPTRSSRTPWMKQAWGCGMFVGRLGRGQLAGAEIDVVVALGRAVDAVGPVQAGVEPLRAVGGRHLAAQHVAHLVEEGAGVRLGVEIAAVPAPVGPGAGQTVEDLTGRGLADLAAFLRDALQRVLVGDLAPQPARDGVFLDRLQDGRNAGLAEILLRQDIAGDLAPIGRDIDVGELENDRAVGIANLAGGFAEFDAVVGVPSFSRKASLNPHLSNPCLAWRCVSLISIPAPASGLEERPTLSQRCWSNGPRYPVLGPECATSSGAGNKILRLTFRPAPNRVCRCARGATESSCGGNVEGTLAGCRGCVNPLTGGR